MWEVVSYVAVIGEVANSATHSSSCCAEEEGLVVWCMRVLCTRRTTGIGFWNQISSACFVEYRSASIATLCSVGSWCAQLHLLRSSPSKTICTQGLTPVPATHSLHMGLVDHSPECSRASSSLSNTSSSKNVSSSCGRSFLPAPTIV